MITLKQVQSSFFLASGLLLVCIVLVALIFYSHPHKMARVGTRTSSLLRISDHKTLNFDEAEFDASQFEELGCLTHKPMFFDAVDVMNQSSVLLELKMGQGCGPLRREWRKNPPRSQLGKAILHTQSNCSAPVVVFPMDSRYGIGSYVGQWSEAMCVAWEHGMRLRSENADWLWMDQTYCNMSDVATRLSPWLCYFPKLEFLCEQVPTSYVTVGNTAARPCASRHERNHDSDFVAAFRAASLEYMFREVSPLVIREAQRQVGIIFGPNGAPDDLITVHIRWGDKSDEMVLLGIQDYIDAAFKMIVDIMGRPKNSTANIYLATEDPAAVKAFVNTAPPEWKVYHDLVIDELDHFRPPSSHYNAASIMAKNTRGRGGLVNMGALLVSLEANYYILTTTSGWSRMLNHIRRGILDPRCGNCTRVIDLKSENWR